MELLTIFFSIFLHVSGKIFSKDFRCDKMYLNGQNYFSDKPLVKRQTFGETKCLSCISNRKVVN